MKTEIDELLDLYALWANSTDDIADILDACCDEPAEDGCAVSLNRTRRYELTLDIPF